MKYIEYKNIKRFHLEITSKCNLLCPSCARTISFHDQRYEKDSLKYKNIDITLNDIKRIFYDKEILKNLDLIFFCGNYSEPTSNADFLDILSFFSEYKNISLMVFTNGSLRNENWWKELAKILNKKTDKVIFSIDGLYEKNSIYRINSNFDKIISNAKSFIDSGGNAYWDFLVFEHNKHQIEEAISFSKKIGFKEIRLKQSHRINWKIKTENAKLKNISSIIPVNIKQDKDKIQEEIIRKYESFENYKKKCKIRCKTKENNSLYIDFLQRLWPCCWFAANFMNYDNPETVDLHRMYQYYENDYEFNSLKNKSIKDILEHDFFRNYLYNSWNNEIIRHSVCGKVCGEIMEFSSNDEKNKIVIKN